ncbi:pseudouridylate synthase [Moraxella caviae]|nr:pseudouridine synthase [Moraxella caviae]OOR91208.1 pseudouridylate synthase [Moraxella caviae]
MIDGVSASKIVLPKLAQNQTVYAYFCEKFAHISPNAWRQRFADGQIFSQDGKALGVADVCQAGMTVFYYRFVENEVVVPFDYEVLFENENIIIVDKPHFLTVSPAGNYVQQTLLTRLKRDFNNEALSPVHRLDKETAGLVIFTKNLAVRDVYQAMFRENSSQDLSEKNTIKNSKLQKIYHAIAPFDGGKFPCDVSLHLVRGEPFYTMQVAHDLPPNTHTNIDVLAVKGGWAKYVLRPTTGKLHQLRVHLNHLGAPIKNDPFYPVVAHKAADDFSQPLQLLAKFLAFTDPMTNERIEVSSKRELVL